MCKPSRPHTFLRTSMKIPPKKPHFFKPILPGFKNELKIPVGFLKYLKGDEHVKRAILKRGGKKWRVKVNENRFEEGWGNFVEENDVELGDMLVFRHEGDMEFEVSVFDSSHCDREYVEYLQEEGGRGQILNKSEFKDLRANASLQPEGKKPKSDTKRVSAQREEAYVPASTSADSNPQFRYTINPYATRNGSNYFEREYEGEAETNCTCKKITSQAKTTENPKLNIKSSHEVFPKVEAEENMPFGPHFIYTISPYCLSRDHVQLPIPFVRGNSLRDRNCTITIRDQQRSWAFALYSSGTHTYIRGTWRKFCIANCLKEGDSIMLEIIANGKNPVLRFYDLRENASLQPQGKNAKRGSFNCIIKPHSIVQGLFYLPTAFARSNKLMRRCEMILRDEKQRSWSVLLRPVGPRFAITEGWRQFIEANVVKVGDTYKFELINNGARPVAYLHCKYSGKDAKQSP